MPEAGAALTSCIIFNNDVTRLLHMVVVSWAGFGDQATTWRGQTMKAHLRSTTSRYVPVQMVTLTWWKEAGVTSKKTKLFHTGGMETATSCGWPFSVGTHDTPSPILLQTAYSLSYRLQYTLTVSIKQLQIT